MKTFSSRDLCWSEDSRARHVHAMQLSHVLPCAQVVIKHRYGTVRVHDTVAVLIPELTARLAAGMRPYFPNFPLRYRQARAWNGELV